MSEKTGFPMSKAKALQRKLHALCFLKSLHGLYERSTMDATKIKRAKALAIIAEADRILSS